MSINSSSERSHRFEIRSQKEVDEVRGRKEVELATEGGKCYRFYTITPAQVHHGQIGIIDRICRALFGSPKAKVEQKIEATDRECVNHIFRSISEEGSVKQTGMVDRIFRVLFGRSTAKAAEDHKLRYAVAVEVPPAKHAMMRGELDMLMECWLNCPSEIDGRRTGDLLQAHTASGELYDDIKQKQQEIILQRETLRPLVQAEQSNEAVADLHQVLDKPHTFEPVGFGQNGALFLLDDRGQKRAVVKAGDQDTFNLNNQSGFASPLPDMPQTRMSESIPHSIAVQQEVLGYQMARLAGLEHVVPKTTMAIVTSDTFHVFTDRLIGRVPEAVINDLRYEGDKTKLVSVQEYLSDSKSLNDALVEAARKDESLVIDPQDFEDVNLFMWLCADQDGNAGNFMTYQRENGQIGLKKIDNSQICGETGQMINQLAWLFLEQMNTPLSPAGQEKLLKIQTPEIANTMRELGRSEGAIQAFIGRVVGMQKLIINNPKATLKEINTYISCHNAG